MARILSNGSVAFLERISPTPNEYYSYLTSVTVALDGNIVVGGIYYDLSSRNYYTWLLKLDENGGVIWSRAYSIAPQSPMIMSVKFINETTMIAAGYNWRSRAWLGAVNYTDGSIIWSRLIGISSADRLYRLNIVPGGLIAVAGRTDASGIGGTDALLMLFRFNGSLVWSKAIGTPGNDEGWDAIHDDGGIVLTGYAPVNPAEYKNDTVVAKFSLDGSLQ